MISGVGVTRVSEWLIWLYSIGDEKDYIVMSVHSGALARAARTGRKASGYRECYYAHGVRAIGRAKHCL
jgi:hypothetical protein